MTFAEGFGDGLGEHRMRADLDERRVLGAGGGDGLSEPHRVSHVGHPIVSVEQRCRIGVFEGGSDDGDTHSAGDEIGQRHPQLRQDGVHHRVM